MFLEHICGSSWVGAHRNFQIDTSLPKDIVLRLIVEEIGLSVGASMLLAAEQPTMEPYVIEAAAKLLGSLSRVLHGENGRSTQLVSTILRLIGVVIVEFGSVLLGFILVGDILNAGHHQG